MSSELVEGGLGPEVAANLAQLRVLVVGAGGLGCEILKNLVCSGFANIDVIDMDTIELTNLNRQFLFRDADVGQPKASTAARRIAEYAPGARNVTAHVAPIEAMPDAFYEQFHIVVCGLDSIRARRWINAKLVELCARDPSPTGLRPLVDGGAEGWRGQCRVVLPGLTPCYECTLDLHSATKTVPLCTIASVPRLPQHCIEWARLIRWPQVHGARAPDYDAVEDMRWLCAEAETRAAAYGIAGVDLALTYGTLKNIVPAVASTNAIVAAACALETLKLAAGLTDPTASNYYMYSGANGAFMSGLGLLKRADCPVCGPATTLEVDGETALSAVLTEVVRVLIGPENDVLPSVSVDGQTIYMHAPALRAQTAPNLARRIRELVRSGDEIAVSHPELNASARVLIRYP